MGLCLGSQVVRLDSELGLRLSMAVGFVLQVLSLSGNYVMSLIDLRRTCNRGGVIARAGRQSPLPCRWKCSTD